MNLWLFSNVSVIVILRRFNLLGNHKKQDCYFVFVEVFVKPDSKRAERVFRCFYDDIFLRMTCRSIRFLYFPAIFSFGNMSTGKAGPTGLPKRGLPGETGAGSMQDAGGVFPFWRVPEIRYRWALPCRDGGFRNVKKQLKSMGQTNRAAGFTKILF